MQNHHQNPNDNLNNTLQRESEQVSYIIEVSIENSDCVAFVQWLICPRFDGHLST
jgi:hypothetical protein